MNTTIYTLKISHNLIRTRKSNMKNSKNKCIGKLCSGCFDIKKGDVIYRQKGYNGVLSSLVGINTVDRSSENIRELLTPIGIAINDVDVERSATVACKGVGEIMIKKSIYGFEQNSYAVVDLPYCVTGMENESYRNGFLNGRYTLQLYPMSLGKSVNQKIFKKVAKNIEYGLYTQNIEPAGNHKTIIKLMNGCLKFELHVENFDLNKIKNDDTDFIQEKKKRTQKHLKNLQNLRTEGFEMIKHPQHDSPFGRVIDIKKGKLTIKLL